MPQPHTGELQPSRRQLWTFDDQGNLIVAGNFYTGGIPDPTIPGPGQPLIAPGDPPVPVGGGGASAGLAPTGTVADAANVQGLINLGAAYILLQAGQFYADTTVTAASKNICLDAAGIGATQWNYSGTGDAFDFYGTNVLDSPTTGYIRNFTIDGASAGPGSAGLHFGDMRAFEVHLAVQNFDGAGSMNVHFDNRYLFTEETHGYLWLSNGTQNLVFDVSGEDTSTNSFGYTDLEVEILAKVGQDGVVLQNGALLYNSRLTVKANFQGSASAQSNAVLRITGEIPAGHDIGGPSAIESCRLDVMAECSDALGTNAPQTIHFGTLSSNQLIGCTGIMDFAQGSLAFAVSNWTDTGATGFIYDGAIRGDFNLNNATVGLGSTYSFISQGARSFGKALMNADNGNVQVDNGDFFQCTLNQDITVNLNPGGAAALASAQRKTLFVSQPATGGVYNYTVAWPQPADPTVTDCAVYWPGGVAPVQSTGAGATDMIELFTYNGAAWYGVAHQAMA